MHLFSVQEDHEQLGEGFFAIQMALELRPERILSVWTSYRVDSSGETVRSCTRLSI